MDTTDQPTHSGSGELRILFIAGYDSNNFAFVELIRELQRCGHRCTVLVDNESDSVNNKMFWSAGIELTPLASFRLDRVGEYHFAFSGPFMKMSQRKLFDAIARKRVFLVSFASLFSAVTMRVPADLVITTSEDKFAEFADNGLRYSAVAIGNPQYDRLLKARDQWQARREGRPIREVLVVDQGAYPFGDEGKDQLAETLVAMARSSPEARFRLKPRYLPHEPGDHLHSPSEHLFSHLKELPDNLELLGESQLLEDLMLESDAMVTLWSTSHLAAIALGMPLMLVGGFTSVDVFDVRKQRVDWAYRRLADTGCLVDREYLRDHPCTFAHPGPGYIRREFYDAQSLVAPRVVDLVELLHDKVLVPGKAFRRGVQLGFSEFMEALEGGQLDLRTAGSPQHLLDRSLYRRLNGVVQQLVFDNRCMGYVLDMSRIASFWDAWPPKGATEQDITTILGRAQREALEMKARFFEANPQVVATDKFVQDHYFDWLFETGEHAALLAYEGPVVVPESLEYNRARVWLRRGRLLRSARGFVRSFELSLAKPVRELRKDKNITVLLSRADRSLLAHAIIPALAILGDRSVLATIEVPRRAGFEALAFLRLIGLRQLAGREQAREWGRQYLSATAGQSRRGRRGLKGAVLRAVHGVYRLLLKGYVRALA